MLKAEVLNQDRRLFLKEFAKDPTSGKNQTDYYVASKSKSKSKCKSKSKHGADQP